MKNNVSYSLGKYESYIQEHFIHHDNCGVLFTHFGRNVFRASIDIGNNELTDYKYIVKGKAVYNSSLYSEEFYEPKMKYQPLQMPDNCLFNK